MMIEALVRHTGILEIVSLQVFTGAKGLSTDARIRFLGHPFQVNHSDNLLGRIFNGTGEPIDGKPELTLDPVIETEGPTVNPMMRVMPSKMIETEVPMIDLFNSLVESQKIPIVERLLVPDMALAVAEKFAVEQSKRVLVLLTDMTTYAKRVLAGIELPAARYRVANREEGV